jgi:hypothetical protein
VGKRGDVAVGLGHLVELAVVGELAAQVVDVGDHRFEQFLLAAQLLRAFRFVPDRRVLERGVDLVQP